MICVDGVYNKSATVAHECNISIRKSFNFLMFSIDAFLNVLIPKKCIECVFIECDDNINCNLLAKDVELPRIIRSCQCFAINNYKSC